LLVITGKDKEKRIWVIDLFGFFVGLGGGMENKSKWNNVGEQVRGALQDALSSGDFRQLNEVLSGTVKSAVDEVKPQVKSVFDEVGSQVKSAVEGAKPQVKQAFEGAKRQFGAGDFIRRPEKKGHPGESWQQSRQGSEQQDRQESRSGSEQQDRQESRRRSGQQGRQELRWQGKQEVRRQDTAQGGIRVRRVGEVSGVLSIVFGSIGSLVSGVSGIIWLIAFLAGASIGLPGAVMLLLFGFFVFLLGWGSSKWERLKRMRRYVELCNGKTYIDLNDLAKQYGKSLRFIKNDIRKLLDKGFFPEGHLDESKTCLMLTDATYRDYLNLEKERKTLEEARKLQEVTADQVSVSFREVTEEDEDKELPEETQKMLEQGQRYISRIRSANDHIPGEVVSDKLSQLEKLLLQIFERIRERALQAAQMQKFMDYYLPTTLKLVQAYEEFDKVDVSNEEILSAKAEIEKALDTINQAFGEVLTNLYRDALYDATTDAQVLQSMLAREGLTGAMDAKLEK
jgi:hypothetical protein